MKAVILAGGEGTRLRPLSCDTPKPMTNLFDRPVMEHTINLLKKHGITDIAATLCYMPRVFEEYFGDGSRLGVSLRYYYEDVPLGTAGGVAACRDFLDGDFPSSPATPCATSTSRRFSSSIKETMRK